LSATKTEKVEKNKGGRPRSAQSHQAILDATLGLLAQDGFNGLSFEGVAERAGVSRATIYRRWASKEELVIDLLGGLEPEVNLADSGDTRQDILGALENFITGLQSTPIGQIFPKLLGEFTTNPAIFAAYYRQVLQPRFEVFQTRIERAQARGELRPDIDPALVTEQLIGGAVFKLLMSNIRPLAAATLPQLVNNLWTGIALPANK
jgi:AcrR family transcriptional regulator